MLLTNADNSFQIYYTPVTHKYKEESFKFLHDMYEKHGEKFIPLIVAESPEQSFMIPFTYNNEEEKKNIVISTSLLLQVFNCTSYIIATECWMVDFKGSKNNAVDEFKKNNKKVSEYEEKVEKFILTYCNNKQEQDVRFFDIVRNGNKSKLKEDKTTKRSKKYGGMLSELFELTKVDPEDKEDVKKHLLKVFKEVTL